MADFARGWWGCDLGPYRPCDGTYQLYAYDSLPAPEESLFHGQFQWLTTQPEVAATPADPAPLAALAVQLATEGLTLPPSFVDFMSSPELQARVPSCTACEWELSPTPVPSPLGDGAFLVRFLRDQQDVLFWYLYLTKGSAAVVCSAIPFNELDMTNRRDDVVANTWWCAPDFEHFVYRFWIENLLWFTLNEAGERDAHQERYLAHYAPAA